MKRRSAMLSTIQNTPAPGAYQREKGDDGYRESRCHACCKSPYGCARNYMCDCHKIPKENQS